MARKSKHEDESDNHGVELAIANWDMQRTQSYFERGRQFENATDEDLRVLFVQAFRDWRANLWGDGRQRVGATKSPFAFSRPYSTRLTHTLPRQTILKCRGPRRSDGYSPRRCSPEYKRGACAGF
jgi:hypothetical protein